MSVEELEVEDPPKLPEEPAQKPPSAPEAEPPLPRTPEPPRRTRGWEGFTFGKKKVEPPEPRVIAQDEEIEIP